MKDCLNTASASFQMQLYLNTFQSSEMSLAERDLIKENPLSVLWGRYSNSLS